ncbi:MAG: hypothetical protein FWB78_04850, partial [Treponema sp.]|nr:hypothetical protein [Treponema sp.]
TLRCFNTGINIGYAKLSSATTMILDLVGHPAVAGIFYGTRSELGVFDRTWSRGSDRLVISGTNYIFRQVRDGTLMDVSRGTFQYPTPTWGSFTINQTHLINYSTGQLELNSQSETGRIGFFMGGHFELSGFSSFPVNGSWHWRRN